MLESSAMRWQTCLRKREVLFLLPPLSEGTRSAQTSLARLRSGHIKSLKFVDKEKFAPLSLVPVLLLLLMSLTVLTPLRGNCGVRGKWTCGTVRATWYHGPGLVLGPGGHETTTTEILKCVDSV
ncbi:hypothetical protein AVEN_23543-1 [Araneus ventricosus]|uniref:Uncharacterized protein n=1 Tax=Araneus ventricosus TaxID=182803 RepID=A0A4Y2T5P9_ARAVE|nr:hypothetical protein AVEN_23543-1 [Araneus ventricosus]